jgi:transcriptional regulator of arginine metabolism
MPTATLEHQIERRRAIARLLAENAVTRQSQLLRLLQEAGFDASQSSVSRDLKDMRAAKLGPGYSLPDASHEPDEATRDLPGEFIRDLRSAGPHLLVVTTAIGAAQRVALVLDRLKWPEVVGTLSGDDTIFIATSSAIQQRRLRARLTENLHKAAP